MIDDREFERFFKMVSDFIDQDMDFDLFEEFDRELEDDFYRSFFNTVQKTVELCHHFELEDVPGEVHWSLMEAIQETRMTYIASRKKIKKLKRQKIRKEK